MSKKDHAERNERLCNQLCKDGVFFDWVITTAFYSALHFVQHEIFPLKVGSRNYPNFDNYYNSYFGVGNRKPSQHKATINLVYEHISDAGDSYKWLYETCRLARYHNYRMPKPVAEKAQAKLADLKAYLSK